MEITRSRLLDAAAELVIEQGFHATTAAMIAERAGYSREMIRVRFGSKVGLMHELLVTEYQQAFHNRLAPDATALDRLHDAVDQLASMSATAPVRLRAAYVLGFEAGTGVPELRDDLVPWLATIESRFAELLRAAVAERSIADVDCDEHARLMVATATGAAFLYVISPETTPNPAAPIRTILDALIRADSPAKSSPSRS